MFRTLCAISWNAPLSAALILICALATLYLIASGIIFLAGKWITKGAFGWYGRNGAMGVLVLSLGLVLCLVWLAGMPRCFVARAVRNQINPDILLGRHFECGPGVDTLRGVSRSDAEKALAQCDEDRWESMASIPAHSAVTHAVLRCQAGPEIDLWADHFHHWNGPKDADVCFTACRPGKCTADIVLTPYTE